ncbi:MAG: hypothetical protein Barrevirus12_3 [Barrevirus sp.]|uniref:Uncharacterized protein n=1 Tax=Barrevirus sp. TaxID=2487763 RepID=A0A3G4ZRZ9_9VIRU|nr:MAG: hypothetical protein Barrevirus12_3 [Barrevirus sp.]
MNIYTNCITCGAICCPNPTGHCNDCISAVSLLCMCCGNNFLATRRQLTHINGFLGGFYKCKTCEEISHSLTTGHNLSAIPTDPNRKISITYHVKEIEHEGYCSDPGEEIVTDEYDNTVEYPLLTTITENDIATYINNPHIPFSPINYYTQTSGCSTGGSGYCGINSEYKMIDIKIV